MLFRNVIRRHLLKAGRKIGVSAGVAVVTLTLFSTAAFAAGTITLTTSDDEFDTGGPLSCSLREAIESANTDSDFGGCLRDVDSSPPYDIIIPAPIVPVPYNLSLEGANEDDNATGDLDIRVSMNIIGQGKAGLVIIESGSTANNGTDRVFHITTDDLTVTFSNITVRNGRVLADEGDSGGGIANTSNSTVTVADSLITGNTALGDEANQGGGGLLNDMGGTLIISDSVITGNQAVVGSGSGGGILNRAGSTLIVSDSEIRDNKAARAGGGIETNGAPVTLKNVDLIANHTGAKPGNGGGFHSTGASDVTVTSGTVMSNTAAAEGGGLWNSITGTMKIDGVTIVGNIASGKDADQGGGGLFNDGGEMTVLNSTIRGNVADGIASSGGGILAMPGGSAGSGGGILNTAGGTLVVDNTLIQGNSSLRAGGGIEDNASMTLLTDVALVENVTGGTPGNGGGFHSTGASNVSIASSLVLSNTAMNEGGGLWNSGAGTMNIYDVIVVGNHAAGTKPERVGGGGIFNVGGEMMVRDSTIAENSAVTDGGGIKVIGGNTDVTNVTLIDNSAEGEVSTLFAMTGTITLHKSVVGTLVEQETPLCGGDIVAPDGISNLATDESCGISLVASTLLGDLTKRWWLPAE